MRSIMGAIFPISPRNVDSLFDQKRSVFVKFTRFKKLEKGSKVVFYLSKKKTLIGEGTIAKVEKTKPETAWSLFGKQIFLNESEYNQYVAESPITGKDRKMTEITVFILRNLKKYKKPTMSMYKVPPSGRYLIPKEYQRIRKKVER